MLNGAGPRLIAEEVCVVALDQLQVALLLLRIPLCRNISMNQVPTLYTFATLTSSGQNTVKKTLKM